MEPLERIEFRADQLSSDYPPRFHHPNKALLYQLACSPTARPVGTVTFSRWPEVPLPDGLSSDGAQPSVELRETVFDYAPQPSREPAHDLEWHLNFACSDLFVAYGGSLMAQDELQVAEHPALASLREALISRGIPALTVERGRPTPVLITGVERRLSIDTTARSLAGSPGGIYGHAFAQARPEAIRAAVRPVEPATISNILAIEAPPLGVGAYSADEIHGILSSAWSGFSAAAEESRNLLGTTARTTIHTGYWGCGAYGGNRVLMSLLQLIAAHLAGLSRLVFYSVTPAGAEPFHEASEEYARILADTARQGSVAIENLVGTLVVRHYSWGVGNGT